MSLAYSIYKSLQIERALMMDTLQLLDKVHSFYSDSFTQLITLTISILVIIGVIMPFVIQSIQVRSFKNEKKSLESLLKEEIRY